MADPSDAGATGSTFEFSDCNAGGAAAFSGGGGPAAFSAGGAAMALAAFDEETAALFGRERTPKRASRPTVIGSNTVTPPNGSTPRAPNGSTPSARDGMTPRASDSLTPRQVNGGANPEVNIAHSVGELNPTAQQVGELYPTAQQGEPKGEIKTGIVQGELKTWIGEAEALWPSAQHGEPTGEVKTLLPSASGSADSMPFANEHKGGVKTLRPPANGSTDPMPVLAVYSAVQVFCIPQRCVGRVLGFNGVNVLRLKAKYSTSVGINQETAAKGYSVCTVRGEDDESVLRCRAEVSRICVECGGTLEDLKKAESILKDVDQSLSKQGEELRLQLKSIPLSIEQALTTGNVEAVVNTRVPVKLGSDVLAQTNDGLAFQDKGLSYNIRSSLAGGVKKDVQIPQSFVGMIIGAQGSTISKIKQHTGADIAMMQDTASEGYSTAQVTGSEEQVNATVEIIGKMIASGRSTADEYASYIAECAAVAAAGSPYSIGPFKPSKVPGLEFLEDEGGQVREKGRGKKGKSSIEFARAQAQMYVDTRDHTELERFQIPKKYIGLLIGTGGEAIKKFREVAATKQIAIIIDQPTQDEPGVVTISGKNKADICQIRDDLQQNLFKAVSMLDAQGQIVGDPAHANKSKHSKGKGKRGSYQNAPYQQSGSYQTTGPYQASSSNPPNPSNGFQNTNIKIKNISEIDVSGMSFVQGGLSLKAPSTVGIHPIKGNNKGKGRSGGTVRCRDFRYDGCRDLMGVLNGVLNNTNNGGMTAGMGMSNNSDMAMNSNMGNGMGDRNSNMGNGLGDMNGNMYFSTPNGNQSQNGNQVQNGMNSNGNGISEWLGSLGDDWWNELLGEVHEPGQTSVKAQPNMNSAGYSDNVNGNMNMNNGLKNNDQTNRFNMNQSNGFQSNAQYNNSFSGGYNDNMNVNSGGYNDYNGNMNMSSAVYNGNMDINSGYDANADTGYNSNANTGYNTNANTGYNTNMNTGFNTNANTDYNTPGGFNLAELLNSSPPKSGTQDVAILGAALEQLLGGK